MTSDDFRAPTVSAEVEAVPVAPTQGHWAWPCSTARSRSTSRVAVVQFPAVVLAHDLILSDQTPEVDLLTNCLVTQRHWTLEVVHLQMPNTSSCSRVWRRFRI